MALFENTVAGEYCKNLIKLEGQENRIFKLVLDNKFIKDLIIFLNTEKQMGQEHIDKLGNELFNNFTGRTFYGPGDPLGRAGQPYEVYRTGEYWDSFRVAVNAGNIVIESSPFKPEVNLFEMYSPELEGLTDESLQILINQALQLYIQWYEQNLRTK